MIWYVVGYFVYRNFYIIKYTYYTGYYAVYIPYYITSRTYNLLKPTFGDSNHQRSLAHQLNVELHSIDSVVNDKSKKLKIGQNWVVL